MNELWRTIGIVSGVVITAGALVQAIVKLYFNKLEAKLEEISKLAMLINTHSEQIGTLDRRVSDLSTRLAGIEGALNSQMRSIEHRVGEVNVSIATLTGQLQVFDRIRGLVGNRVEDKKR